MNVLVLSPSPQSIVPAITRAGDDVVCTDDAIDPKRLAEIGADFIVSYGYRFILREPVLAMLPDRAINLHIAYLPWNRGADPNFWSFVDHSPKGATIHYLDHGIDTGDIIAQRVVEFDAEAETFSTSYAKLRSEVDSLFAEQWDFIRTGACTRYPQTSGGTVHKQRDKLAFADLLRYGWDTRIAEFLDALAERQMSAQYIERVVAEIAQQRADDGSQESPNGDR